MRTGPKRKGLGYRGHGRRVPQGKRTLCAFADILYFGLARATVRASASLAHNGSEVTTFLKSYPLQVPVADTMTNTYEHAYLHLHRKLIDNDSQCQGYMS